MIAANAVTDTILLALALLLLAALAVVAVWDYWRARAGRRTISKWALALWARRRDQPAFWLTVGLVAGFVVGLVVGTIAGHLFWPQYVPQ